MDENIPAREVLALNECGNYKRKLRIVIEREVAFAVPPWRTVGEQYAVEEAFKARATSEVISKLEPMNWKVISRVDICQADDI